MRAPAWRYPTLTELASERHAKSLWARSSADGKDPVLLRTVAVCGRGRPGWHILLHQNRGSKHNKDCTCEFYGRGCRTESEKERGGREREPLTEGG